MNSDILKAKEALEHKEITCVFCRNNEIIVSDKRGVKPLVDFIEADKDYSGYSVADRVVGNGAAYLYVILNVKEIYAKVISKPACDTLDKYGIRHTYDIKVESIRNRTDTDICPMERAVMYASTPQGAFLCIKKKMTELNTVKGDQ